ncbi:hypothetical protein EG328_007870 [Venturia inaequalis]|uniref:FMN hydroxy acid dehydrogenase domain-containing protein n=1 Tax=Venturia inaequalis TaxID=5025 RepID=A0A8H3VDR3_VENIN|nr:hypothetical protein EG328_007870 [Venturia inaequalis]
MAAQPSPVQYETSVYQAGLHDHRPPFTFKSEEWEPLALARLSASSKGYVHGNAGSGGTYKKNLAAFEKYSIVPNRLVPSLKDSEGNSLFSDSSTTVLGQKLNFPIAMAPVGVLRIFNPEGEIAAAKAANAVGVTYIMSTASSTSIEDVAEANGDDGHRWYQLYWPPNANNDITISILNRAKKAGFKALFVTLDTYVLGWRPSDMDNGYNPFLHADRIGVEVGFTDPVFQAHFKKEKGYEIYEASKNHAIDQEGGSIGEAAREWASLVFPGHSHTWEDIKFLQEHWDGPIVLKGIQSVSDAKKAVEAGVQGIVVSNHGGRQQDGGAASLSMLPKIVDAVGSKLDILFDSGIRCGADALKAIALGAKLPAVLETVKKDTPNKGKRFYKCQNWKETMGKCDMFLWEEEAATRAEAALLNQSRTEPRYQEDVRLPPRQEQFSVTPTPSYDFRAPSLRAPSQAGTFLSNYTNSNALDDGEETEDDFEEAMIKAEHDTQPIAQTIESLESHLPAPATPRTNRADPMVTPGKRKYSDIGLETPQTMRQPQLGLHDSGYGGGDASERRASKRRAVDSDFLTMASPQSSPTPSRFRNAEETAVTQQTLFKDISAALTTHGVRLSDRVNHSLSQVCARYERKTHGLGKGREIARLALTAREAKVAELEHRINTLGAELNTERAIVKHLREAGDDDTL